MVKVSDCVPALALALLVGCAAAAPSPPTPAGAAGIPTTIPIVFFFLVNESGRTAWLDVTADGRQLFTEELPAVPLRSPGATVPPPGRYPTRELKVPLDPAAHRLDLVELGSGAHTAVDLGRANAAGPGFRVTIGRGEIRVTRDYFPIR